MGVGAVGPLVHAFMSLISRSHPAASHIHCHILSHAAGQPAQRLLGRHATTPQPCATAPSGPSTCMPPPAFMPLLPLPPLPAAGHPPTHPPRNPLLPSTPPHTHILGHMPLQVERRGTFRGGYHDSNRSKIQAMKEIKVGG